MATPLAFVERLLALVSTEQCTEETESSLLLSSCPFSLLVHRGLALSSLSPSQTSIGLSGRTLIDLERSSAVSGSNEAERRLPAHGFRTGDLAVIIPAGGTAAPAAGGANGGGGAGAKEKGRKSAKSAKGKAKEVDAGVGDWQKGLKGVVYKVTETRIVLALGGGSQIGGGGGGGGEEDEGQDEVELGSNLRLVKLANPTTYERQTRSLIALRRLIEASQPTKEHRAPPSPSPPPATADDSAALTQELHSTTLDDAPSTDSASPAEPAADGDAVSSAPPPPPAPPRPREPRPLSPLLNVLLGLSSPSSPPSASSPINWIDSLLNSSQQEAVQFALSAPEVALLWGPPGTGKTQTLVEIIRQLVARGERVLVCGGSNLSVDNILERLSLPSSAPPIPLTRIGHPARVLGSLVPLTLDAQSARTDASELLGDVKAELLALETRLRGTGKDRVRGKERKEKWAEVRELRKEFRKREGGVVKEVLSRARVVLATTHGAGSRVLERFVFDTLVIDEAAQCVEPSAWIPILKAKKLILGGDHLQLPPTVKSGKHGSAPEIELSKLSAESMAAQTPPKDAEDDVELDEDEPGTDDQPLAAPASTNAAATAVAPREPKLKLPRSLTTTLFSRLLALHGPSIRRMLEVSYRFNSKICAFPSRTLYGGKLLPAPGVADRKLTDLDGVTDEELEEKVVFIDTAGCAMYERAPEGKKEGAFGSESKANENEAQLCVEYVQELVQAGVQTSQIALLAPYNAQVKLLSSMLGEVYPDSPPEVGSVDSMQGREADVVIISLVRSNERGEVGFLAEPRRLNVAMTRPRRQLVVVGDSETVAKGSEFLKRWMSWLEDEAVVRVPQ